MPTCLFHYLEVNPGDWVDDDRLEEWYRGVLKRSESQSSHFQRRNSTDKEFLAKSKERMEQRNVEHKHHITRLNVVGGAFSGEQKGGGAAGLTPSEKQQRLARAAAEAAEAREVAAVKAAEERVAVQRARVDKAHKQRLRMIAPDTVKAETGAWERSTGPAPRAMSSQSGWGDGGGGGGGGGKGGMLKKKSHL